MERGIEKDKDSQALVTHFPAPTTRTGSPERTLVWDFQAVAGCGRATSRGGDYGLCLGPEWSAVSDTRVSCWAASDKAQGGRKGPQGHVGKRTEGKRGSEASDAGSVRTTLRPLLEIANQALMAV
ncbi:hypothetical protein SKAU_G00057160 [Synaphobranchus kaupii]|uniref:Uncharacterized protein n=1 Tax=Synaphobranchus kaupii TaxID=118154 RepID=A0A9Q1J983_SYNKA|nr:hypothetical protein SKAU_G00057160 [Synaphobranchus kaupii]